jgi:acetyl esterase
MVDSFFLGLASISRLHPRTRPESHGIELVRDVPYLADGHPAHLLDVYRPAQGEGPWPVVLYAHGGSFRILSKETHRVMGLSFARRGMVVFNINYRLAPRHRYPAALKDCCAALRWVYTNAPRFGGDCSQLILAGESAGANLVTGATVACCYPRPEPWAAALWDRAIVPSAVVPACGILQVSDPERFGRRRQLPVWVRDRIEEVSAGYLGPNADPASCELADPLLLLESSQRPERPLPPFFASVGTRDPLLDDTRRLGAALARLGVSHQIGYYPGEMHAFQALVWRPEARRYWRDLFGFLDEHSLLAKDG